MKSTDFSNDCVAVCVQLRLAAATVCAAVLLGALGVMSALMLVGSTTPITFEEGSDAAMRFGFWYGFTFTLVLLFGFMGCGMFWHIRRIDRKIKAESDANDSDKLISPTTKL